MRRSTLSTIFAGLSLAAFTAAAQDATSSDLDTEKTKISNPAEDPEIQALENEYAAKIVAVRRDLGEKYLNALKGLQHTFTTRRQIEQALLIKLERERIGEVLETDPIIDAPSAGARPQHEVTLDIAMARCSGGARYDERRQRIRNWDTVGATALWDLDAETPPGRYELIVNRSTGPGEGGSFEIFAGNADAVQGTVATDPDAAWDKQERMLAGVVVIGPDTRTLAITCTSLEKSYLWILYGVTLAPPGTWVEMEKKSDH